jgi:hypothetical protein
MISKLVYVSFFVFILYAIILALCSNQKFPEKVYHNNLFPYLADKPITEDGYLTLTVAWNIAQGKGITYNFNRPTTGIQPLSGFIFAVIAKGVIATGGDKINFVRVVIIFSILVELLFFFIINTISRTLFPALEKKWINIASVILTLLNFELLVYFTNGLETGIYLVCLGISLLYSFYYFKSEKKIHQTIFLGIIFGLCGLARIDFIVVVAALLLINLYKRRLTLKQFFAIGITTSIIISPWIFYIYKTTGFLIQSSARTETSWLNTGNLLRRMKALSLAIMEHLTPNITTGNKEFALVVVFIITIILTYKYLYDKKIFYQLDKDNIKTFISWSIGILSLLLAYLFYSTAYYFYIRYTAPLLIIILPFVAILLAVKLSKISKKTFMIGYAVAVVIFFIQAILYFHSGRLAEQQSLRMSYIENHFNNMAIIGCFQSGVTGYYDSNVYNLDGKMDHVVTKYISSGNLARFIDSTGINVIIDWNEIVDWFDINCLKNNYLKNNWIEYNNNIGDNHTVCLIRKNSLSKILIGK